MCKFINAYCQLESLETYDPYDIWKTRIGFVIKDLFNRSRAVGLPFAGALTVFDLFLNNRQRVFYLKKEYPIVRAFAALSLLNVHSRTDDPECLRYTRLHLEWLVDNACTGYFGKGWGLGFDYPVTKDVVYSGNTPFSTVTPYALEAFLEYENSTGDYQHAEVIRGIFRFFEDDIKIIEETNDTAVTSYGPWRDRIAFNSIAYTMYSLTRLMQRGVVDGRERTSTKVKKLYTYLQRNQMDGGQWLYSPEGNSFIDCFHSCFMIKNILKTSTMIDLEGCGDVIDRGYRYIKRAFWDHRKRLFKRFSKKNKPGIIAFDLYDNAEALNLAVMMADHDLVMELIPSIFRHFCDHDQIYSQIDCLGRKRNSNTLRWAVMPFIYALSVAFKNGYSITWDGGVLRCLGPSLGPPEIEVGTIAKRCRQIYG